MRVDILNVKEEASTEVGALSSFSGPLRDPANSLCGLDHAKVQLDNILVLSEIRLVREALAEALRQTFGLAGIHGVDSLVEASAQVKIAQPGVALVDATHRDGLAAARWLRRLSPAIRLIAFSMEDRSRDVAPWIDAGIDGYVCRSVTVNEIVEVIAVVMRGEFIGGTSSVAVLARNAAPVPDRAAKSTVELTPREEEVVRLIIAGESNKEIARILDISVATVKSHVHNLLGKLGLQRRGRLALRYDARQVPGSLRGHLNLAATGAAAPAPPPVADGPVPPGETTRFIAA